ncbi:Gremlin-2 [Trichinella pseudospiralis]|uniref:Gremlin-2 n=2 Tax=Trichinella pseudospiralis TaxID=6337 RepID=A0A0V1JWR7_TRIPS|nr:Gremlin-2 [Trichinella pseudospiralis]
MRKLERTYDWAWLGKMDEKRTLGKEALPTRHTDEECNDRASHDSCEILRTQATLRPTLVLPLYLLLILSCVETIRAGPPPLNSSTFRHLSRMAFRALSGADYEDTAVGLVRPGHFGHQWHSTMVNNTSFVSNESSDRLVGSRRDRHRHLGSDGRRRNSESNKSKLWSKKSRQRSKHHQQQQQLYPNKRQAYIIASRDVIRTDYCRTIAFKQRIRIEGCLSKTVINSFCYGQCNSFYIPRLHGARLVASFKSCSVCQPSQITSITVTLHCPGRLGSVHRRKYLKVKQCACMSVDQPIKPTLNI